MGVRSRRRMIRGRIELFDGVAFREHSRRSNFRECFVVKKRRSD